MLGEGPSSEGRSALTTIELARLAPRVLFFRGRAHVPNYCFGVGDDGVEPDEFLDVRGSLVAVGCRWIMSAPVLATTLAQGSSSL